MAIFSNDVQTAATDGFHVIVNPGFFIDQLSLAERTFVLAHEIMHNVFGDVQMLHRCNTQGYVQMPEGDRLPFVNEIMQVAMDARINALLIESSIGKPPKAGVYDKAVQGSDSVYTVYRRYLGQQKKPPGDKPGDQQGAPSDRGGNKTKSPPRPNQGTKEGQQFDDLLKPGEATAQDPHQAAQERSDQRWAVELAVAKTLQEKVYAQGKMPGSLKILFEQLLEPEVDWREHIQMLIRKVTGDGSVNWYEPNVWLG